MQIPLALRALFRAPVRWTAARLTRHPAFWVPSDARRPRQWDKSLLGAARTPGAVRAVMTDGDVYPTDAITASVARTQALSLALHAGHLSPALLDWCIRRVGNAKDVTQNLRANPAVTPAHLPILRRAIEERIWRETAAERVDDVGKLFRRNVTVHHPLFSELLIEWLLATHPDETRDDWTPFMAHTVAQHVDHRGVLRAALTRRTLPAVILQEVRRLVDADHVNTIREVCRHAPRILTIAEIERVIRRRGGRVADAMLPRFAVLLPVFDVLPVPLRERYWPEALRANPAIIAPAMVAMSGARWPGLTATDLAPLLAHSAPAVRLAGIQLLAGLEEPSQAPMVAPDAPDGAVPAPSPAPTSRSRASRRA